MSDELRMDAYYYGFEPTGVRVVDEVLSAVAHAGKAFHNTEDWTLLWYRDEAAPHGGSTAVEGIQNAANHAAEQIRRLLESGQ